MPGDATSPGAAERLTRLNFEIDLVVGSGLEFAALGARSLRGVPGEWPLHSVVL